MSVVWFNGKDLAMNAKVEEMIYRVLYRCNNIHVGRYENLSYYQHFTTFMRHNLHSTP